MKKILLLALLSAICASGCRTPEFYQDQAVQKARTYLLKKCPQLSYEESSFIRYNKPAILHSDILGDTDSLTASTVTSDMKQIQIVWHVPGNENFYSVWGACSSTMRDFSPERIFIRKFRHADTMRIEAVKRAKAYITGHLFGTLSVEDYNDIRFREPEISFSSFELEKSLSPDDGCFQFAMIWQIKSKPGIQLVVIGNARRNLADFIPVSASELAASDILNNLKAPYKTLTPEELAETEKSSPATPAAPSDTTSTNPSPDKEKLEVPSEAVSLSQDEITDITDDSATEKTAPAATDAPKVEADTDNSAIVDELPEAPELELVEDLED